MRTLIAIPCMDMVHTIFMKSLLGMRKVPGTAYALSCSSLVYDARNSLVTQAIEENFDRILWLDSDMDLPPDLMTTLAADMDEGRDMVSGLYIRRREPVEPTIFKECCYYEGTNGIPEPHADVYLDYPQDQIFEIAACGFGGTMMSVAMAKRVKEEFGVPFSPLIGFGEDISFCMRARELGYKIWCDSRPKIGHVGFWTVTENTYLAARDARNSKT